MAEISKSGTPSLASMDAHAGAQKIRAITTGEAIAAGDACYVKSDGKIWKSSGALTGLNPPDEPALATATSGGTVAAGIYGVKITYKNATGETLASESSTIATTGATSTITITSPAASGSGGAAATHYLVYMTPANGGPWKLQNGSGTAIATDYTRTAPPVTNTAEPPTSDGSGSKAASKVHGYAWSACDVGEVLTLLFNVYFRYGASLTPGANVYLSGSTAGGLADAPSALGVDPIGFVLEDGASIYLYQSRY